jgi:acetyltransferase
MNESQPSAGHNARRSKRAGPARGRAFHATDGRTLRLRAIHPGDIEALQRGFARLTPEQVRQRIFHRMTELSDQAATTLANVDPAKAAAYVAVDADGEIRGEARIHVDADNDGAEFALIVDPEWLGLGVGRALMRRLVHEARRRGLGEIWGKVLSGNSQMLEFSSALGAVRESVPDEPDLVRVRITLR